jgi:enamine deaminase RidA (YjgF/YER057c/UK114 family)
MAQALTPEERLAELGLELPAPPPAVAAYVPWVRTGNIVMTSGQLPWRDGVMAYEGKLGAELSVENGYQAARLAGLNAIAQLKDAVGELSRVTQLLRLEGNVHCAPGFQQHPQVLNGASELLSAVFLERGRHTRTALGINEMPLNAAVQLSLVAEVEGGPS